MKNDQDLKESLELNEKSKSEFYFSEVKQVFYQKKKNNHGPVGDFKFLITCENKVFKEFLKYLERFKTGVKPEVYTFKELESKLKTFLFKEAGSDLIESTRVA